MKYWQSGTGELAEYARTRPDGIAEWLDERTMTWVRSDPLASEIPYSGDWVPITEAMLAADRGRGALAE